MDKKIEAYQEQLAAQDLQDDQRGLGSLAFDENLTDKISELKERQAQKKALQTQLVNSENSQVSTVDADARLLSKRGQTVAGYNVQIAVDAKHKLIVSGCHSRWQRYGATHAHVGQSATGFAVGKFDRFT